METTDCPDDLSSSESEGEEDWGILGPVKDPIRGALRSTFTACPYKEYEEAEIPIEELPMELANELAEKMMRGEKIDIRPVFDTPDCRQNHDPEVFYNVRTNFINNKAGCRRKKSRR